MSIPMVEVFKPKIDVKVWEAVSEPINSSDKLEWFEDLNDWQTKVVDVVINGKTKKCTVYLSSDTRGWVSWHEFTPSLLK